MPPTKDYNTKQTYSRSLSDNGMSMKARVYHPATNLMPTSPTGRAPFGGSPFGSDKPNNSSYDRQNSNGKYH